MANTAWSKEKIKQLIELLHNAPALWDSKCKEFHDRGKKSEELQHIASVMNVSEEEVAKKIKSVKTQYRREYTKQMQHEKNGLSSAAAREKEWFGYRPLSFLRKNITSKEADSPEEDNSSDDDKEDKDDSKSSDSSSEEEVQPRVVCPTEKTYLKAHIKKETLPSAESNVRNLKRKIHDDLFNGLKQTPPPKVQDVKNQLKDDLTIYGENVASRMRNSMQGYREIAIARHEIDKILFRLEMGEFR